MLSKKIVDCLKLPRIFIGLPILLFFVLVALLSDHLVLWFQLPMENDLSLRLAPPQAGHLLGCDLYGGDLLKSIILGSKTSLSVSFATLTLSLSIGVLAGILSGYFGGWIDWSIMRIVDILMAFPGILIAMSLAAVLGPSLKSIVIAIAATGWTATARLIRGQVITLKTREYVTSAKALGAKTPRILWKHIFPGVIPHLLIVATFSLSGVILVEASLSFLGLSSNQDAPSWGTLLSQGKEVLSEAPHLSLFPGLVILILVLGLNFLGDGLRDALDPKMQH